MNDFEIIRRYVVHVSPHVGAVATKGALNALQRIEAELSTAQGQARKFKAVNNALNPKRRSGGCG